MWVGDTYIVDIWKVGTPAPRRKKNSRQLVSMEELPMTPEEEPGDPPPTIAKEPAINPKIILTGPGISIIPK